MLNKVRIFVKLSAVIEELVEEKGLDRAVLSDIICQGIKSAYEKKYPNLVFQAVHDKKTDELEIHAQKVIVSSVADEDSEISSRKVKALGLTGDVGQSIFVPFEGKIGRIEILRAKQVIASSIKDIEATAVYDEFKDKKGTIVYGVVHKSEYGGTSVKLDDTMAFLPKSLSIPGQKHIVGYPLRALLKDVLKEPRHDNQLILDMASVDYIKKLFELEIPEVFEKIVEIKEIVRIPGYKTKIIVSSRDEDIDPVGTCVGVGGVRIKPILKELGSEKIDIIAQREPLEALVADALKPAEVYRVELSDDEKSATVWVNEDQRSLAIGKLGQNIALASRLVGVNIQIGRTEEKSESIILDEDEVQEELVDQPIE